MKLNTTIISLCIALITGCNFSAKNVDANKKNTIENDSPSVKEANNQAPKKEFAKHDDKLDSVEKISIQQPAASTHVVFSSANFGEKVLKCNKPVVVFFTAEWCTQCRLMYPIVNEIEKEYDGKAIIGKLDIDVNKEVAQQYGVRNIPMFLFFKDGKIVDKQVGAMPKAAICSKLNAQLN